MTPTNKLRWNKVLNENVLQHENVLQQWWQEDIPLDVLTLTLTGAHPTPKGEWRDVRFGWSAGTEGGDDAD